MPENNLNREIKKELSIIEDLLKEDSLGQALRILNDLISFAPDEPEIYKNFGWIAFKQQKLIEAENHFKKALSLDEENSEYHYNLGWIYFYQSKLDLAERHYKETIKLVPDYPLPYINLGAISYENTNFQEALGYYHKAESLRPRDTHLLNNLADTYNKVKDYNNAIKTYNRIIEIDPENARAYGNLAVTYNESGNPSKAEELCKKALSINPQSVNGHFNLANIYLEQYRLNEALEEINLAKDVAKHINKFILELSIKIKKELSIDYTEDSEILEDIHNEDPLLSKIREKNHYQVIDILLKRLEYNINDFFSLSQLAYTLSQIGRYTEAIDVFESALSINSDDPWTNQHYAFALLQSSRKEEAVIYFKRAIELNPEQIWPRKQLAETLIQLNRFIEASEIIQSAINISEELDDIEFLGGLFSLKASVKEKESLEEAIDWYLLATNYCPEESYNYENISVLLASSHSDDITKLELPENLCPESNNKEALLSAAINNYRLGNTDISINLYRELLEIDINYFPAYAGISQALYEKRYGTIYLKQESFNEEPFRKLVTQWDRLSKLEQNIIYFSTRPMAKYLDRIIKISGCINVVPIDTKLTSLPKIEYLKHETYLNGKPYDGLRALGGINVYIGIERLRDLLWIVPNWLKQVPASIAHEFAHQVYEVLPETSHQEIETIYEEAINKSLPLVSEYSSVNSQEYFAENYAMYCRNAIHNIPISKYSKIIAFIESLIYNN